MKQTNKKKTTESVSSDPLNPLENTWILEMEAFGNPMHPVMELARDRVLQF